MASIAFVNENRDLLLLFALAGSAALLVWDLLLQRELSRLKKNAKVLFAGKAASDLEAVILGQQARCQQLEQAVTLLKDMDQRIIDTLAYAVQKVGVVRFNPFGEVGGNQSFAVAWLDNFNSGVIMLSLYSRDGVRIYAKPVKEGRSEYQLSKEEEEALRLAMEK